MLSAKTTSSEKVTTDEICQMLRTLVPAESQKIDVDTDIVGTGLLDSVAMVELILWLEEDKQIRIPEEDLLPENFRSVRVIHEFLGRLGER